MNILTFDLPVDYNKYEIVSIPMVDKYMMMVALINLELSPLIRATVLELRHVQEKEVTGIKMERNQR